MLWGGIRVAASLMYAQGKHSRCPYTCLLLA